VLALGAQLVPLLWQLPPTMGFDADRLAAFFALLPGFVLVGLGIGFGGGLVCLMAVLSNYFGTRLFASLAGLAVAINTTLSAITPYLAGWRYDAGHGYGASFYFLAFWCLIGGAALVVLRPPSLPTAARVVPLNAMS